MLKSAYESVADEEEWVHLGPFGSQLTKLSPSFDSRNYGYKKLSELVQSLGIFTVKKNQSHIMIKLK